jgi:precorrin-2/cobalt-factor-2 C20-methyltransferase
VARNEALTVIPAPIADEKLRSRLAAAEASAIVKVGRHLSRVRAIIGELGLTEQAWYVERATLAAERVLPLARVASESAPYFSMILIQRRNGVG